MPLIEDEIDKLVDSEIFCTLYLKNAFLQVEIDEKSKKYTAFVTHNGQYQFLRAPFGLCMSPPVFRRFINNIFHDLIVEGNMTLYLGAIILKAQSMDEAYNHLVKIFKVASEYGLTFNFEKCSFMKERIEFLGHIVKHNNVYPSPSKVDAVICYPEPRSLKEF